jgi:hypothetical protein
MIQYIDRDYGTTFLLMFLQGPSCEFSGYIRRYRLETWDPFLQQQTG